MDALKDKTPAEICENNRGFKFPARMNKQRVNMSDDITPEDHVNSLSGDSVTPISYQKLAGALSLFLTIGISNNKDFLTDFRHKHFDLTIIPLDLIDNQKLSLEAKDLMYGVLQEGFTIPVNGSLIKKHESVKSLDLDEITLQRLIKELRENGYITARSKK